MSASSSTMSGGGGFLAPTPSLEEGHERLSCRPRLHTPHHEARDRVSDRDGVGFEREVAGIEEAHLCVRKVALEGFGTGGQEEEVVASPHRKQGRPLLTKVRLD